MHVKVNVFEYRNYTAQLSRLRLGGRHSIELECKWYRTFGVQKQHKHMWHFQIHLIYSNENKGHVDKDKEYRLEGGRWNVWGRGTVVG